MRQIGQTSCEERAVKIEAVTVCVGYADFLRETIPFNLPHLDRWLIVTDGHDEATREVCRQNNLEFLATDDFYSGGAKFDKARGIDHGMHLLAHDDWVLHLDADIVLPPHARHTLRSAGLDQRTIYGADRVMVRGWERWQKLRVSGFLQRYSRSHHFNVCFPGGFDIGARWADVHQGYVPIGFFQLFHRDATMYRGIRIRRYSNYRNSDAARTDVQFALQWDRERRAIVPELVVLHLESEETGVGANWSGRTTRPFGPAVTGSDAFCDSPCS
jgi:hypothetical protein